MVNEHILSQLVNENEKEVFKSMRTDMAGAKALLNEEQFAQFMRAATINQTILADASFRRMNSTSQVVSSTKIVGRVLQSGYKAANVTQDNLTEATIGFGKAELNATKLKAKTSILDDDKEDNIEQAQFEQTLLTMMGEAVGVDLEALSVYGDTTKSGLFACFDGWLKTATTHIVQGTDYDVTTKSITDLFDQALYNMPAAYRQANLMKDLVYYVPFEVYEAYRNHLIDRETGLGDSSVLNYDELKYKGIPVKYAPVLDAVDGRTSYGKVAACILTVPEFLWYGVWKDLSVEPNRVTAEEKTEYYYRIRCDASLQWNDAIVVADMTAQEAAALL